MAVESTGLELMVSLSRDSFQLHEDIPLTISFKNNTEYDLYINKAFNYIEQETRLIFNFNNPDGGLVVPREHLSGKRPLLNRNDFQKISKGELYEINIIINNWHSLDMVGEYKLRASYINNNDGAKFNLKPFGLFWKKPSKAWVGEIHSNILLFNVH